MARAVLSPRDLEKHSGKRRVQQRGEDRTCAGTAQCWPWRGGGWEPRKKKEELEGVSRTAGVTDQEAGGRERRGNASQQIPRFAIFR